MASPEISTRSRFKLLLATRNPGKIQELRKFLDGIEIDLYSLEDFPWIVSVEESGSTYAENAKLKASAYAQEVGMHALADDSGLEVEALDGDPGLFSARYGGVGATDSTRTTLLLRAIESKHALDRRAAFICVVAVADPAGETLHVSHGSCEGILATEPRGKDGFGYDPIFIPSGYKQTFAELPAAEKDRISHRAKAMRQTSDFLRNYLARQNG